MVYSSEFRGLADPFADPVLPPFEPRTGLVEAATETFEPKGADQLGVEISGDWRWNNIPG